MEEEPKVRVYCQECGREIRAVKCEQCAREELTPEPTSDPYMESGE